MERVARENVSHLSFIQEPRGQNKAWIKGGRIQEGYSRLRELLIHQQKEFERKRAEIREREEKRKRTYAEGQATRACSTRDSTRAQGKTER